MATLSKLAGDVAQARAPNVLVHNSPVPEEDRRAGRRVRVTASTGVVRVRFPASSTTARADAARFSVPQVRVLTLGSALGDQSAPGRSEPRLLSARDIDRGRRKRRPYRAGMSPVRRVGMNPVRYGWARTRPGGWA